MFHAALGILTMDKFERYVTSIKRKYRERLICREKQWPPCKSSKLVKLELVVGVKGKSYYSKCMRGQEREDVKRTSIKYNDLFKVESGKKSVRKVLVEGDAGIGKTTLSIAVCEDWANEKLFQQFKLLLLLPLRHRKVASVGSLPELLKLLHSSEVLCASIAEYLKDIEGDEVLIIADGWDEISKSDQLKGCFLYELLFEDVLPFASVIVTSRYSASMEFHEQLYFDRFVEITGFNKDNILEYVQSEFISEPVKGEHLRQQFEDNTLVESVCSVPLNCAIVCHLWQHNHKEGLPTTMTELYSIIIRNIILRNTKKDVEYTENNLRLSSFDGLPEDLKQPWNLLCKFAFETIVVKDQMVFSEDELDEGFTATHKKKIFSFGLLQESLILLDDGFGKSYHFLHRTFQEFLAAFHLAKLVSESSIAVEEVFRLFNSGGFDIVWRFLFGIYFNAFKGNAYHAIMPYVSHICAWYKNLGCCNSNTTLSLCHSAFEAKNGLIYEQVIQALLMGRRAFLHSYSAHDCAAAIDVINHMQDCEIYVNFEHCGIGQDQINYFGTVLNNSKNLEIQVLELKDNKLVSVESLFSTAHNSFQSLYHLNLRDNMIKTVNFLKSPLNSLTSLYLSNNPLGIGGMKALQTAVAGGSLTSLSILDLDNCLTRDTHDNINPIEFSKFLRALSAHCHLLMILDLSRNNLGVNGAFELAKVKSQHVNFFPNGQESLWWCQVRLTRTNLGDDGLRVFTKTLDCTWLFDELLLGGNNIHATGLGYLVDAIGLGKILFTKTLRINLELESNPLGLKGLAEIGKLLSSNKDQLTSLSLKRCQLTDPLTCDHDACNELLVGQQMCQMPQNNKLTHLYLDGNNFTGDGIHILAGFMHLCPSLETLSTTECTISSFDFSQLLDKLAKFRSTGATYCHDLCHWILYGNKIDDKVVLTSESVECRPSSLFPRLTLNLSVSWISDELAGKQEVRIYSVM